jgi:hypothetical protein
MPPRKLTNRSRPVGSRKSTTASTPKMEPKLPKIPQINIPTIALPSVVFPVFQTNSLTNQTTIGMGDSHRADGIIIPEFKASNYLANDLFSASSPLEPMSEVDREAAKEKIAGQKRRMETVLENLGLNQLVIRAEGAYVGNLIEARKVDTQYQNLKTEDVKFISAQTKTGIEHAKLEGLQHDLNGETQSAALKGESWQLKLDGLSTDLNHARKLLDHKKEQLAAQLVALRGS